MRVAAILVLVLFWAFSAPFGFSMDEIDNVALNAGLNPRQEMIRVFVEYMQQNGVHLEWNEERRRWIATERAPNAVPTELSLRTFSIHSSEQQMRSALQRINLAYQLNPKAHLAMEFTRNQKISHLFENYVPPVAPWKPSATPRYDKPTATASLYIADAVPIEIKGFWRYEPAEKRWKEAKILGRRDGGLIELTKEVGLFWLKWMENGHQATAFVYSGPILCNDVCLPPAPKGMVAVCVPYADRAEATYVPDPGLISR